ncbi:hypothetical protein MMC16_003458 [Acarospora aff. strigata]|nr:hypothetical protein [Acarospora aff. strigata]
MTQIEETTGWFQYPMLLAMAVQSQMIDAMRKHQIAVNDFYADESDFTKWTVSNDTTIQPPLNDNPQIAYQGIELKSPALPYSSEAVEHVSLVISLINRIFEPSVNASTGFHVHVGSGNAGFSLQALKSFASLATIFQRQIHSIHAIERLTNPFCAPPGEIFQRMPPLEIAKIIHAIPSMGDFMNIFLPNGNRFQAYNFENLKEGLKTIEFRQHKGTMDRDEVTNYIHLVCGLVCASHHAGPAGFTNLIIQLADLRESEQYSFLDLMNDLELDRLIPYYSTRLQNHRTLSYEWHPDMDSPKGSPLHEEDSEDPTNIHLIPAWTGSPEFEMRPRFTPTDPVHGINTPQRQPDWANIRATSVDWRPPADFHQASQHLNWGPPEPETKPALGVTNPDNDPDSPESDDGTAEWSDFDWDWREEALKSPHQPWTEPDSPEGDPTSNSELMDPQSGDYSEEEDSEMPPDQPLKSPDSPEPDIKPKLMVLNPDNDPDSP